MAAAPLAEKMWKPAFAVGGVATVGAFVFYGLYEKWLSLPIFERLSSDQTYNLMLLFLVLVFVVALFMVAAWMYDRKHKTPEKSIGPLSYSIPENCTFEQAVRALAAEDNSAVNFVGFAPSSLRVGLRTQSIDASDTERAIELLKTLTTEAIPRYVVRKRDGLITVAMV